MSSYMWLTLQQVSTKSRLLNFVSQCYFIVGLTSVIIASTYPTSCESSFVACVDLSIHILQKLEKLRVLTGMSHDIAWSNQRVYPFGPAEQAGIYCIGRTHATLQVTVCADDPAMDYWAVREELRMYNPEYCARPHVVALNKMDLQDAAQLQQEIACEVLTMARRIQVDSLLRTMTITKATVQWQFLIDQQCIMARSDQKLTALSPQPTSFLLCVQTQKKHF